jgi:hypothetical protein
MKPTPAQLLAMAAFHDKAAKAFKQFGQMQKSEQAKRAAEDCRAKAKS